MSETPLTLFPLTKQWNTMRQIREALGLPMGNDGIVEFLAYWDSLKQSEREEFRSMDLSTLSPITLNQGETS